LDDRRYVKYNAALLFGKTRIDDAGYSGHTFRLQVEYPF
jgi:hypothetical protein